jgi:WD40 repeat protein
MTVTVADVDLSPLTSGGTGGKFTAFAHFSCGGLDLCAVGAADGAICIMQEGKVTARVAFDPPLPVALLVTLPFTPRLGQYATGNEALLAASFPDGSVSLLHCAHDKSSGSMEVSVLDTLDLKVDLASAAPPKDDDEVGVSSVTVVGATGSCARTNEGKLVVSVALATLGGLLVRAVRSYEGEDLSPSSVPSTGAVISFGYGAGLLALSGIHALQIIEAPASTAVCVATHPYLPVYALGLSDGRIQVWDAVFNLLLGGTHINGLLSGNHHIIGAAAAAPSASLIQQDSSHSSNNRKHHGDDDDGDDDDDGGDNETPKSPRGITCIDFSPDGCALAVSIAAASASRPANARGGVNRGSNNSGRARMLTFRFTLPAAYLRKLGAGSNALAANVHSYKVAHRVMRTALAYNAQQQQMSSAPVYGSDGRISEAPGHHESAGNSGGGKASPALLVLAASWLLPAASGSATCMRFSPARSGSAGGSSKDAQSPPTSFTLAVGSVSGGVEVFAVDTAQPDPSKAAFRRKVLKWKPRDLPAYSAVFGSEVAFSLLRAAIVAIDWDSNGRYLAVATSEYELAHFEASTGFHVRSELVRDSEWHTQSVSLGWSVSGIWHDAKTADAAFNEVLSVARNRTGKDVIATGCSDGAVRLYSFPAVASSRGPLAGSNPPSRLLTVHSTPISAIEFGSSDDFLVSVAPGDPCGVCVSAFRWPESLHGAVAAEAAGAADAPAALARAAAAALIRPHHAASRVLADPIVDMAKRYAANAAALRTSSLRNMTSRRSSVPLPGGGAAAVSDAPSSDVSVVAGGGGGGASSVPSSSAQSGALPVGGSFFLGSGGSRSSSPALGGKDGPLLGKPLLRPPPAHFVGGSSGHPSLGRSRTASGASSSRASPILGFASSASSSSSLLAPDMQSLTAAMAAMRASPAQLSLGDSDGAGLDDERDDDDDELLTSGPASTVQRMEERMVSSAAVIAQESREEMAAAARADSLRHFSSAAGRNRARVKKGGAGRGGGGGGGGGIGGGRVNSSTAVNFNFFA